MNKPADVCELTRTAELFPAEPIRTADSAPNLPALVPDNREFDWNNDDSVVLREQRETAIYWNPAGDLVLRQRADWNEEDDPFLVISANNVDHFLDRLTDICGIPSAGKRR